MDEKLENDLYRENLEISSNFKRILSYIIDYLLINIVISLMLTGIQSDSIVSAYQGITNVASQMSDKMSADELRVAVQSVQSAALVLMKYFLLYAVVEIIYNSIFTYKYGATLGKVFLKIKIINKHSFDTPGLMESIIRSISKYVLGTVLYFGFIFAFISKYRTTLHDKIANTIIVNN